MKNDTPSYYTIHDLPEDERPRERLLTQGPETLSNKEILAIMIGSGVPGHSALDLAKELLDKHDNNLSLLGRVGADEIMSIKGLGKARAAHIIATLEFGRRKAKADAEHEIRTFRSANDVFRVMQPIMVDLPEEHFRVLMLDTACQLIRIEEISIGGIDATIVDLRTLFRKLILGGAARFIAVHNHPSGNSSPSRPDKELTMRIQEAAKTLSIRFDDHIIIGKNSYFSFNEEGLI
ncbi:MAG: DNA repair protein RadC [Bacteroidales bacterium]|nr:DNA repair protein RadC [Bacteroidales bacterium]